MKKYTFVGYVLSYGRILGRTRLETIATSRQKAMANMKYQFRVMNNISCNVPLTFDGKVVES